MAGSSGFHLGFGWFRGLRELKPGCEGIRMHARAGYRYWQVGELLDPKP